LQTSARPGNHDKEQNGKDSPQKISKVTHQQLSAIFKKIGSKDHTKEVSTFYLFVEL
jgi:hypothetical protein